MTKRKAKVTVVPWEDDDTVEAEVQRPICRWSYSDLAGKLDRTTDEPEWYGGPIENSLELLEKGDQANMRESERLFDRMLDQELPNTDGGVGGRVAAPCGGHARVGAALRGHPNSMWRREPSEVLGKVRVYFQMVASQSVKHETMRLRGLAITALAYAWQCKRPIELIGVISGKTTTGEYATATIPIGTAPLNMSRVAAVMSNFGLTRRLYKAVCNEATGRDARDDDWYCGYRFIEETDTIQQLANSGSFDVDDVFIMGPRWRSLDSVDAAIEFVKENQRTLISD